jgi:hypothetical protein
MGSVNPPARSGLKFLQELATASCKECHAEWQWDATAQPQHYRLTVSDGKQALTFQIEGKTLRDLHSDAFRDFCLEVLRRCLNAFRPDLTTVAS